MRILIYQGHPAQYHFFKNIIRQLSNKGHEIKILIKSKDILEDLLMEQGFVYENILQAKRRNSVFSIFLSMLKRDVQVYRIAKSFKPDLLLGSDTCVAHVGWLLKKTCYIIGEDDYSVIRKLAWLMMPFPRGILAPFICDLGPFEKKKIGFNGYMKLSYLHPEVFKPNFEKVRAYGSSPYCIIRLAELNAHHDKKIRGIDEEILQEIIRLVSEKGMNVCIDSERDLPARFTEFALHIKKSDMHDLMAFASLIISDSQSMSVEAAVLGVPSIRFNDFAGKISVLEELEHKYGLTFGIKTSDKSELFRTLKELLGHPDLKGEFQKRRNVMLKEKINVLQFMVDFLESDTRLVLADKNYC